MSLVQPYHRRLAESTMTATIVLRTPDAPVPIDEATGQYDPTNAAAYATVKCRIMPGQTQGMLRDVGDSTALVAEYIVAVPLDTEDIASGHIGLVTNTDDPILEGRDLRVDEVLFGSLLTERRLRCSVTN